MKWARPIEVTRMQRGRLRSVRLLSPIYLQLLHFQKSCASFFYPTLLIVALTIVDVPFIIVQYVHETQGLRKAEYAPIRLSRYHILLNWKSCPFHSSSPKPPPPLLNSQPSFLSLDCTPPQPLAMAIVSSEHSQTSSTVPPPSTMSSDNRSVITSPNTSHAMSHL